MPPALQPIDLYLKRRDQLLYVVNHETNIDKRSTYLNQLHNCILEIAALAAERHSSTAASAIRGHKNYLGDDYGTPPGLPKSLI
jgi:hypothetical protein